MANSDYMAGITAIQTKIKTLSDFSDANVSYGGFEKLNKSNKVNLILTPGEWENQPESLGGLGSSNNMRLQKIWAANAHLFVLLKATSYSTRLTLWTTLRQSIIDLFDGSVRAGDASLTGIENIFASSGQEPIEWQARGRNAPLWIRGQIQIGWKENHNVTIAV